MYVAVCVRRRDVDEAFTTFTTCTLVIPSFDEETGGSFKQGLSGQRPANT